MSIETIRGLVKQSRSRHTKTKIVSKKQIDAVLKLFPRKGREHIFSKQIDVPINRVVSLMRENDAWKEDDTWEDVLYKRLHGKGWGNEIFTYFREGLFETPSPAPNASGYLKLISYHGLTVCTNGNHRLAAMVCWLGATKHDRHPLKEASTMLILLNEVRMEHFKAFYGKSTHDIFVKRTILTSYQKEVFNMDAPQVFASGDSFYTISDKGITKIEAV